MTREFGPYLLLKTIAEGGTGAAYLAVRRDEPGRALVVKRLRSDFVTDPVQALRLRHEGTIAVSVDSRYVVRVDDVGAVDEEPYIAMEHVAGWPCSRLLQHLRDTGGALDVRAALALTAGILRGLDALHAALDPATQAPLGAVHRDLSPRNVLIDPSPRPVIIDLGLGRSNVQEWATRTGTIMGTPGYMAPEQLAGLRVDHRADLYSAAVIGFELLTVTHYLARGDPGAMAEEAMRGAYRPISWIRSEVPSALDDVFARALSVRAGDRFETAGTMCEALERAVGPLGDADRSGLPEAYFRALASEQAELDALISEAAAHVPAPVRGRSTIFATRDREETPEPSITAPGPPMRAWASEGAETSVEASITAPRPRPDPPEEPPEGSITVPRPAPVRPRRAPRSRTPLLLAVTSAISLSIGAGGMLLLQRLAPPPPPAAPAPEPAPVPLPRAAAVERTEPAATDSPAVPPAIAPDPPARRRAARIEPEPTQTPAPALPERLDRLSARAAELKRRHPELAGDANSVLASVALWRASADTALAIPAIEQLESRLRALEERAGSE